ncbi:hypothetical protein ACI65C_006590 [Semiaphis heraclei]
MSIRLQSILFSTSEHSSSEHSIFNFRAFQSSEHSIFNFRAFPVKSIKEHSGLPTSTMLYVMLITWEELKAILKNCFEPRNTSTHLLLELTTTRQKFDEDVGTFYERLEKLFHLTLNVQTKDKNTEVAEVIEQILKAQTLSIFVEGLKQPVKMIVKASHPSTIEEALAEAQQEETSYKSDKKTQSKMPKQEAGKMTCFNCGKVGHTVKIEGEQVVISHKTYNEYMDYVKTNVVQNLNIMEVAGNIFEDDQASLVHHISQEWTLKEGLALEFRRRFGNLERNQNKEITDLLYLKEGINNSYPDFHSLALNAKQLDVLLQPNVDDIEY